MKRCPITYEIIANQESYSQRGLRMLSSQLKNLNPIELSADDQRQAAIAHAGKMSIQGMQTKLSAQLRIKEARFEIVDQFGHYILKPQSSLYPELPENEALTMSLAELLGLEVPIHGLVYSKDNSMTYFVKRFDRYGHRKKLALEDFAQLSGEDRYTKYESSMEKVANVIAEFCTFPKIEFIKLLKLTLFNFLIGNEDMHLKNFSLITRDDKVMLSPSYDLLNTTIAIGDAKEELALPLNGKKNNLRRNDFLQYFSVERLGLNQNVIEEVMNKIREVIPEWKVLISDSFLSSSMQKKYLDLLEARRSRLDL
jgi:serine/threonine-protein kinase HipA